VMKSNSSLPTIPALSMDETKLRQIAHHYKLIQLIQTCQPATSLVYQYMLCYAFVLLIIWL